MACTPTTPTYPRVFLNGTRVWMSNPRLHETSKTWIATHPGSMFPICRPPVIIMISSMGNNVDDSGETFRQQSCPECGTPMEAGFVTTNHSLRWTNRKSVGNQIALLAEPLTRIGWFRNPKCPAIRCRGCKIVMFRSRL